MLMLGLNESTDRLDIATSVCWYGHVLRRDDDHVFRRSFDLEVEDQRKKCWPKRIWMKQVEE